jgi:hypothetical protein
MQHAQQGEQVEAQHLPAKRCGMSDIVERLRNWRNVHLTQLRYVMESAADEIERLRLTDLEREAIERAADWLYRWQETHGYHSSENGDLAMLRSLLSRIGDCPVPENAANDDNESVRKTGGDFGQPTLTDEERAVLLAIESDAAYRAMERTQRVVRGILERLG